MDFDINKDYYKYKKYKMLYKTLLGGASIGDDWDDMDIPLTEVPLNIIVSGDDFIISKEIAGTYEYDDKNNQFININDTSIRIIQDEATYTFQFIKLNGKQIIKIILYDNHLSQLNMSSLTEIPNNEWRLPLNQARFPGDFTLNIYIPKPIKITIYEMGNYYGDDATPKPSMIDELKYRPNKCNASTKPSYNSEYSGTYNFDFHKNLYFKEDDDNIVLQHDKSENIFYIKQTLPDSIYIAYHDVTENLNYQTINKLNKCHWGYTIDRAMSPGHYRPYSVKIQFVNKNVQFAEYETMEIIDPPSGTRNPRYTTKGERHSSETRKGLKIGDKSHPPTKLQGGKYY